MLIFLYSDKHSNTVEYTVVCCFSWFTLVCLGQGPIFVEARHYTSLPSGKFRSNALGSTGLSLLWQAPY